MTTGLSADSPFHPVATNRVVYENAAVVAFYDRYPVSPGHVLVVARQVTASLFELSETVQAAVWAAVPKVLALLQTSHRPAGFNIGLNDGQAAGQTIAHAHIHIIPRYSGDQPDPRGGVRWVLPEKAAYWELI